MTGEVSRRRIARLEIVHQGTIVEGLGKRAESGGTGRPLNNPDRGDPGYLTTADIAKEINKSGRLDSLHLARASPTTPTIPASQKTMRGATQ